MVLHPAGANRKESSINQENSRQWETALYTQDFQDLEIALRVSIECEKAWDFWVGRAEKFQGRYQLQVHELKRLCDALEKALSLEELTNECRERIRQYPAMDEPIWLNESQVKTVIASCRFALARQLKRECEREIPED